MSSLSVEGESFFVNPLGDSDEELKETEDEERITEIEKEPWNLSISFYLIKMYFMVEEKLICDNLSFHMIFICFIL